MRISHGINCVHKKDESQRQCVAASFYNSSVDLRKTVLAQEEQNRVNFERLQEAAVLKAQKKRVGDES